MKEKRTYNLDRFLKVKEAAEVYQLSIDLIYDALRRGHLQHKRFGRVYRIRTSDLETWANEETHRRTA